MGIKVINEENINSMVSEDNTGKSGSKFGVGLIAGIFAGIVVSVIVSIIVVNLYTGMTGNYLVIGKGQASVSSSSDVLDEKTVSKVEELAKYIDIYFNDEYTTADIQNGLLEGVMEGLGDPYSVYYNKEKYEDLKLSTIGTYYGIGAGLSQNTDTMVVTISKVYKGTPAEEAGLMTGDKLVTVGDIDATSMEVSELVTHIRGKEGTKVHLKVYRESSDEYLEFDVERKNIELPSVEGEMLENNIGYIQISEFQTNTAAQFEKILADLEKKGMKGLIVDVRSNPGGLLTSVVDILDDLLPEGTLVYTEDKYGEKEVYSSDANCVDFPMVVLVNENSASASEIFAGAIKDYEYGTLVGKKTFGKGIVQSIITLEDGDALKITTAKYFTPKGNYIHGVGITPDVELDYEYSGDKEKPYEKQYDNQLQKAIEIMNQKLSD